MASQTIEQKYGFENPFKPDPLAKKAMRYLPRGGQLLDVGCGEGADSVFFARNGFTVTAIDRNKDYIQRLGQSCKDEKLSSISIHHRDVTTYRYPRNRYDVVISLLVICCMKRSEFEKMLTPLKQSVKPAGIIVMSSRNYLDPEMKSYLQTEKMIEPNTFRGKEDCCQFFYFIEKNRLHELFQDFQILYYREGFAPCKYGEHEKHGDSYIICKRKK
ncbi:MAG: class I SAM-dependent methyltransferase [Bacteroidota bacterium]